MRDRPSLADLRTRVFKHSGTGHAEVGNWLARRVGRPSAVYGTWAATRIGASAHVVTLSALAANLLGAAVIAIGTATSFVAGVAALIVAYWLDHVDGQVARWRGTSSLGGVYFDYLMHHVGSMSLGFALGFGIAARRGSIGWAAAGFLIAIGWCVLGLQNDCRYKAFFQRLKSDRRPRLASCDASDRPAQPPPPPRTLLGRARWVGAKSCEHHVVLVGLIGLAAAAIVSPWAWDLALRACVIGMAAMAPTLAAARAGRAIASGAVDAEFDRWFRPT